MIDATGAPPVPHRAVVVEQGVIRAILPVQGFHPPRGARVFEGHGKFLIPGLWDMHVHLSNRPYGPANSAHYLPLLVSFGVTGVRDMSGRLAVLTAWRDSIQRGTLLGPRMVVTGFKLGGQPVVPGAPFPIRTEADVRKSIRALKLGGADFVKLEESLPLELLFVAVQESRALALPLVGHLVRGLSLAEASRLGYRSVEHLDGLLLGISPEQPALERAIESQDNLWHRLAYRLNLTTQDAVRTDIQRRLLAPPDAERAGSVFALLARGQTWQVPTLSATRDIQNLKEVEPFAQEREPYFPPRPPRLPNLWDQQPGLARQVFTRQLELIGQLHRAGVPILAGTDLPGTERLPGFALVEELELLVRAGLSPLAALQSATLEPARYLAASDTLGSVEPGKVADLVLLDADPLLDIRNVHRVHAVVLRGRLLPPSQLDSLRSAVRRVAAHWRDSVSRQQASDARR